MNNFFHFIKLYLLFKKNAKLILLIIFQFFFLLFFLNIQTENIHIREKNMYEHIFYLIIYIYMFLYEKFYYRVI